MKICSLLNGQLAKVDPVKGLDRQIDYYFVRRTDNRPLAWQRDIDKDDET